MMAGSTAWLLHADAGEHHVGHRNGFRARVLERERNRAADQRGLALRHHRSSHFCSGARGARQCRFDRLGGHDLGGSNFGQALGTASKTYAPLGGAGALLATYVALLAVLSAAAIALKADVRKFALAFTAVFWIAYAS